MGRKRIVYGNIEMVLPDKTRPVCSAAAWERHLENLANRYSMDEQRLRDAGVNPTVVSSITADRILKRN